MIAMSIINIITIINTIITIIGESLVLLIMKGYIVIIFTILSIITCCHGFIQKHCNISLTLLL